MTRGGSQRHNKKNGIHLERMEEDRMPKKIFTQELEGTKRRGRPMKGWREEVERDLQVLGVRKWRELVTGQNGGTLFDRPKPTPGCSANGRRKRRGRRRRRRRRRRRSSYFVPYLSVVSALRRSVSFIFYSSLFLD